MRRIWMIDICIYIYIDIYLYILMIHKYIVELCEEYGWPLYMNNRYTYIDTCLLIIYVIRMDCKYVISIYVIAIINLYRSFIFYISCGINPVYFSLIYQPFVVKIWMIQIYGRYMRTIDIHTYVYRYIFVDDLYLKIINIYGYSIYAKYRYMLSIDICRIMYYQ